jgi:hypothetical protein
MNRSYTYIVGRFVLLVASQVLLIDHMQLGGYINPPVYALFILLLPFQTPGWILLISSFLLGLTVDIFSNSTGLHAASSVFMAFMRPYVIRGVGAPADYEGHLNPGIHDMGTNWFLVYSGILIFMHQLVYGILESFYLREAGIILLRVVLSSLVTLILVVVIEYLFTGKKK